MRVQDEQFTFSVYSAMGFPGENYRDESVNLLEQICSEKFQRHLADDLLVAVLVGFDVDDEEVAVEYTHSLDSYYAERRFFRKIEPIEMPEKSTAAQPSIVKPPELELKQLPDHLEYAYLGEDFTLPVIIAKELSDEQRQKLIKVPMQHKRAIGWTIADIRGIDPSYYMHWIFLEDGCKPVVDHQRRFNPIMKKAVKKEIIKWLDAGIIYPISDSSWVSPVQCVPKK